VKALIEGGEKPIRPILPTELVDMPELMPVLNQCWAESPLDRPTFDEVNKIIRRLNKGRYVL